MPKKDDQLVTKCGSYLLGLPSLSPQPHSKFSVEGFGGRSKRGRSRRSSNHEVSNGRVVGLDREVRLGKYIFMQLNFSLTPKRPRGPKWAFANFG